MHQIQSGAVETTASLSSSQITVKKTHHGALGIAFVEKVQQDTERGWLFIFSDDMTIQQLSCNGTHSLVVTPRLMCTCVQTVMPLTRCYSPA